MVADVSRDWRPATEALVRTLDVGCKVVLATLLALIVLNPDFGNLEGKAPFARAVTYPLLACALPLWHLLRPPGAPYPWTADLLLTLTGFSDILGNRLDLYDRVVWFDDWMHFMNTGLVAAAVVLLTLPSTASLWTVMERAICVGMTASLAWELFEYLSFVTKSAEHAMAYSDTIGDLTLGWLGACVGAVCVHGADRLTRSGRARRASQDHRRPTPRWGAARPASSGRSR